MAYREYMLQGISELSDEAITYLYTLGMKIFGNSSECAEEQGA